jgi:hypothetical protein
MDEDSELAMEMEALDAIYDQDFTALPPPPPSNDDDGEKKQQKKQQLLSINLDADKFVSCTLLFSVLVDEYPDAVPAISVSTAKGLAEDQVSEMLSLATTTAHENVGAAMIFTIAEVIRELLADNDVEGQDDNSMYAQMIRKSAAVEKAAAEKEVQFESQKTTNIMSEAERIEEEVLARRAHGTPCTAESFAIWKASFDEEREVELTRLVAQQNDDSDKSKNKEAARKEAERKARKTGFQQFEGKSGDDMNLETIEAFAEEQNNANIPNSAEDDELLNNADDDSDEDEDYESGDDDDDDESGKDDDEEDAMDI